MGTERIFGGWNEARAGINNAYTHEDLQVLWHALAAHPNEPNFGLSQRKHEIIMLWQLYVLQKPKTVLEIGTAQGGTFAAWCWLGVNDATIISIDRCVDDCRPRPGDPGHPMIYNGPLKTTKSGGGLYSLKQRQQTIYAINGWSYELKTTDSLKQILAGRNVDFLFHDASHEATMFERDFGIYWPLVNDGGVFAAHDIIPSTHPDCNKSVAWDKIKQTAEYSACFEFTSARRADSMGIGVLIK